MATNNLKLGDIPLIANSLKCGPTESIRTLNTFLNFTEFDRSSRKRIRNFSTFPPDFDLSVHKTRLLEEFSLSDFISVANVLHVEIKTNVEELCNNIFDALTNLELFQNSLNPTYFSEEEETLNSENDRINNSLAVTQSNREQGHSPSSFANASLNDRNQNSGFSFENNVLFRNQQNTNNPFSSFDENAINTQFWFLLRDISANCRKFSGDDFYSVNNFFSDIEENFSLFPNLSSTQKLIFVKRLITGTAKSFLFSQRNLNTYDAFKSALLKEFSDTVTSIEIHRQLEKRKKKHNETFLQYFTLMRELASRCDCAIDDSSVMQYVINGIDGTRSDKIILYGANSFSEFKQKLMTYETIVNNMTTNSANSSGFRNTFVKQKYNSEQYNSKKPSKYNASEQSKTIRCYNCNDINHISKNCPNRARGPRCLKCNLFGHKSPECNQTIQESTHLPAILPANINTVQKVTSSINMVKNVIISDYTFDGLVDTGSNFTLLRESAWIKIGSPPLKKTNMLLTGFGFARTNVIGSFDSKLIIDDQNFFVTIFVVPNACTNYDLIMGCDLIQQANLNISPDGVKFSKNSKISDDSLASENFIMSISDDPPNFDIGPKTTKQMRVKVEELLFSYKPNKVKTVDVELNVVLTDNEPVFHKPRRLPFAERDIVDSQVDEWLQKGIIEPCTSPYASQVVVVKKKDGKPRVCIDYRRINRKLIKDAYPLPLIDDILDRLQSAKIFTTLDLKNGFLHVPVNEKSRNYTSFVTHNGQYQFKFMPFGLSTCPSTFMRYINAIFRELINKGIVLPYMDDLVIPASDEFEAFENLKSVLEVARDHGLEINFKKCQFLHNKIEFLGHVIEDGKLYPSPSKTKAVINYPELKNIKDVRRFLGLTGYFRKFINSYSSIAKPLSDLLRKDTPFRYQSEQRAAFQKLKYILSQKPVLSIFNQNAPTEIHTDASIDGLGAVLFQKSIHDNQLHPVFYMSKKTSDFERKYTSFELEVLAVVEALKKFRIYILGLNFKIVTDCDALVKTLKKKDLNSRIARWALYLQEYNYTIEHRTGTKMNHVDALSRAPSCMLIQNSVHQQILHAQNNDEKISALKTLLQTTPHEDYIVKNNLLYKITNGKDLIVVPDEMQLNIIRIAHEHGHFGVLRTQESISKEFFIPHLKEKVEKCIQNCITCILNNRKRGKQDGLLHPLEKEDTPLHTYHVDHIGPLATTSKKYKHIFVVIDSFTKFTWLYPTKSTDTAEVINKLESQRHIFGNPTRIISDKGSAFTSTAFKDYCKEQNILHCTITTGLPRSNGQVERQNSTIVSVLSKLSADNPEKWYSHVPHLQQIINSTFQRSIKTTPFELLFGIKMKSAQDVKIVDLLNDEIVNTFQQHRDELRQDAKKQITKVQNENRRTYNLRRKQAQKYQLNDLVAIKRTQYGPGLKLKQKYLGPYKVSKVKPNDTYDVIKCDFVEGPSHTSTCAEYMKPWSNSGDAIT